MACLCMLHTMTMSGTHGVGRSAPRRDASLPASQVIDAFVIGTSHCHRSVTPTVMHLPGLPITSRGIGTAHNLFFGLTSDQYA